MRAQGSGEAESSKHFDPLARACVVRREWIGGVACDGQRANSGERKVGGCKSEIPSSGAGLPLLGQEQEDKEEAPLFKQVGMGVQPMSAEKGVSLRSAKEVSEELERAGHFAGFIHTYYWGHMPYMVQIIGTMSGM